MGAGTFQQKRKQTTLSKEGKTRPQAENVSKEKAGHPGISLPGYHRIFVMLKQKTHPMDGIAINRKCGAIMLHYDQGFEGLSMGIAENYPGLPESENRAVAVKET